MLQNIRDNIQGTIAKIIVALIAIPFALFGVEAFFTGGEPAVAKVDGEEITERELARSIEMERRRIINQAEGVVDSSIIDEETLRGPALEGLVGRKVLQVAARDAGIKIGDEFINSVIVEDPTFQENGVFSQARFQGLLAASGLGVDNYRSMLREDLQIQQLLSGVADSEFVLPQELGDLSRLTQQSLRLRYMTINVVEDLESIEVSDDEIQTYFEDNVDDFMTEETVSVDYLELRIEMLFEPVAEEDLRVAYQQRLDAMPPAISRRAAHIMLESLDDDEALSRLQALRAELDNGADFAELARQNSEDTGSAEEGGDLGFSAGDAFPEEFEAALATLAPGEVSEPVQTDSGWHLIKLLDVRELDRPSFESLRAEIEEQLQREAAEPLFVERAEELADLTFNSDGLSDAADALDLIVQQSDTFSRSGGEGLFANQSVIKAAFGNDVLTRDMNSELIEIEPEHVVVIHKNQYQAARQKDLAEVADQIRVVLREAKAREQVLQQAEEMLAAIGDGATIEELANNNKLEWQLIDGHRRGGDGIAEELSEAAFALQRSGNEVDSSLVSLANGDAVVFQVSEFKDGPVETLDGQQLSTISRLIIQGRGREVAAEYQQELRDRAGVELL